MRLAILGEEFVPASVRSLEDGNLTRHPADLNLKAGRGRGRRRCRVRMYLLRAEDARYLKKRTQF
jgi:hypothetical protein